MFKSIYPTEPEETIPTLLAGEREAERAYCQSCRCEIQTESGQLCAGCSAKQAAYKMTVHKCSTCGEVKYGDLWQPEAVIHESLKPHIQFSHGFCPTCCDKMRSSI